MKFGLKGITDLKTYKFAHELGFSEVGFDLRPKSFNFTQGYKIKEILKQSEEWLNLVLQFESEKEFVIKELINDLQTSTSQVLSLAIENPVNLKKIDELAHPYSLKYQPDLKLSEIKACENLTRLVFGQEFLDELNQNGELFGFFDIIRSETDLELEVQTDWDSAMLMTLIDTYNIEVLSWEINNKVELSYRCLDFELVESHMQKVGLIISESIYNDALISEEKL